MWPLPWRKCVATALIVARLIDARRRRYQRPGECPDFEGIPILTPADFLQILEDTGKR
jgi:hypothetical protein